MVDPFLGPLVNIALKVSDRQHENDDPLRQLGDNKGNLVHQLNLLRCELERNDFTMWDKEWKTLKVRASELEEEGKRLLKEYSNSTRSADLSKNMKEKAGSIASHRHEMTSHRDNLIIAQRRSSEEIYNSPQVKELVDRIWTLLDKKNIKKVVVFSADVNKTTRIMKSLHDKAVSDFERVMFIDSKDLGTEDQMGEAILRQLNRTVPSIPKEIESEVSKELQDKKYLLLLNRVPRKIDLEKLGILNIHTKGKVVAATRDEDVYRQLGGHDYEWVKSAGESWKILREIVGEIADDQEIKPLAQMIAKECGKKEWLIRAVGMHLKDMENKWPEGRNKQARRSIWEKCKDELQSHRDRLVGDCDDARHVFQFLCEKLTDSGKNCLLYGALFPQDERIYADFLIECWGVEGFIRQDEGTSAPMFKRTRVAGYKELQLLINAGLLETYAELNRVSMPPLFRRWALGTDCCLEMLVRCTEEDKAGYPEPNHRGSKKRISLRSQEDMKALLDGVSLNGILALFLHRNPNVIEKILSSIFVKESPLRILDLGRTGIKSLPGSISNLTELKALYLNDCGNLRKLPSKITKLNETLEILDVSRTGIPYLPAEIGELSSLKCLRVSFNTPPPTSSGLLSRWKKKSRVPTGDVISRLSSLEELTISVDEKARDSWGRDMGGITQHTAKLGKLTTLHLHFPSVEHLADFTEQNSSWKTRANSSGQDAFRSFKFIVGSFEGDHDIDVAEHKAERHFQVFAPGELSMRFLSAIQDVLHRSTTFELIRDESIDHLSCFGIARIAKLKVCAIRNCSKMESIISNSHSTADAALPHLEVLELFNLCSLTSIFGAGSLERSSFANLTTLIVVSCDALRVILPFELAQNVTNLKHLTVKDCRRVEAIIAVRNTASRQVPVATDAANENRTRTLEAEGTSPIFLPNEERLHNGAGGKFGEITEEPAEDQAPLPPCPGRCQNTNGGQVEYQAADQNPIGKLETLILDNLAYLRTISRDVSLRWPSLQKLMIVQCYNLENLPLSVENVDKLKIITCHEDW